MAEIVGEAIALNLLSEIALSRAAVITGAVAFGLLAFQNRGYRRSSVSSRVC